MTIKRFHTDGYNMVFDTSNGNMMRWGNTVDEDPSMSPLGPEIADIEITSICEGPDGIPCKFCYKGNSRKGENMNFETFQKVFNNIWKVKSVVIETENGKTKTFTPHDIVSTKRGEILAQDLQEDDELIN